MRPAELVINVDLRDSLGALRGEPGEAPDHVDVLAAFLYSLSKGYGLSESQHLVESQLELAEPPEAVAALFGHVVGLDPSSLEGEAVRDALYRVFLDLSGDIECRQSLNRNQPLSESGVLTLAQVFWNIEGTPTRPHLPLRPLGEVPLRSADIPVQGSRDDYAVMMWTQRTNLGAQGLGPGAAHRSSGQGFRIKGARLAVLAALRLVRDAPEPLPDLAGATFVRSDNGDLLAIGWPPQPDSNGAVPPSGVETTALGAVADPSRHEGRVVVGWAGEVGPTYQPRSCDDEMTRIWAGDGDRRVWLRGGPGFGKTFIARRVMQEALRRQDAQRERLLVWVDSADADTVATAFSRAAEQLRLAPDLAEGGDEQRARSLARSLIVLLAGCDWPWLVVLDNADPGSLFQAGLVPPGRNPQGRVVITTLGHDSRMVSSGHVLPVEVFTPDESERYVRVQVDPRTGGPAALSRVPKDAARSLARAVAGHPLALSIAVATIVANHMEVEDWIAEFESAAAMDAVGDSPDAGGYPLLVAAAWGLALDKAAAGSSPGVVLRAAAVAAVQDPDGHPTWLWEQEAIRAWVAGQDELVVSHGQPRVVRSLVDHGLCEVRGDSWRVGRLGMHQLAARAVRERLPAEDVSHLAAILLEEWLLGVTGAGVDQSHRANIATLAALPGLTGSATTTARALLAFLPTGDPEGDLVWSEEWLRVLREIDPAVLEGSQKMIAEGLVELADALRAVERHDESNRAAEEALAAYEVLLAGPAESPAQTAAWWIALGDLQQRVGRQGRDAYSQAASILDHLVATTDARRELIELLGKLASVRLKLGEPALAAELRGRREDLIWQAALDADPSDVDWGHALAQWAAVLRSRGEFVAASIEYARAAEVFALREEADHSEAGWWMRHRAKGARHDEVDALVAAGRFSEAEARLASLVDDEPDSPRLLVQLASLRRRLGRPEADEPLARAAERYDGPSTRERRTREEMAACCLDLGSSYVYGNAMRSGSQAGRLTSIRIGQAAVDAWRRLCADHPGEHDAALAHSLSELALRQTAVERWAEAQDNFTRAVHILQMLVDLKPGDRSLEAPLGDALVRLGIVCDQLAQLDEAKGFIVRGIEVRRRSADLNSADWYVLLGLALASDVLASVCNKLGQDAEASNAWDGMIELYQQIIDLDPKNEFAARTLAQALESRASRRFVSGSLEAAHEDFARAAALREALAAGDPASEHQVGLARNLTFGAVVVHRLHRAEPAVRSQIARSISILELVIELNPSDHGAMSLLVDALMFDIEVPADGPETQASLTKLADLCRTLVAMEDAAGPALVDKLSLAGQVLRHHGWDNEADELDARAGELSRRIGGEGDPNSP